MIPFNLFKYIYLRNITYIFTIYLPCSTILYLFLAIVVRFSKENSAISLLISLLSLPIFLFFFNKFILNKLIFKDYKQIKIETILQSVSFKLTIMFIIIVRILLIIPALGFTKLTQFLFNNTLISFIFLTTIGTVMDYYITNLFLEKYIKVSSK